MSHPERLTSLLLAFLLLGVACDRELSERPPPLRPLVYTEAPEDTSEIGEEDLPQAPRYIAPEDLGLAIFQALVEHDHELFESVFITAPELVALINSPIEQANERSADTLYGSEDVWQHFSPEETSEAPVGGLTSRFKLLEFSVGKGRDLQGRIARPGRDTIVQHWRNDLRIELRGTDKIFTIRVPKIVRTEKSWKVADKPLAMSPTLRMYLQAGMHLKSNLLLPEHYPFPLQAGNYWKYRINTERSRRLGPAPPTPPPTPEGEDAPSEGQDPEGATPPGAEAQPTLVGSSPEPTVRHKILEVHKRQGFLIATFESKEVAEEVTTTTFHVLATPRLLFPCARDCRSHIDDIAYLLGYMNQQTPLYVFPFPNHPENGPGWGKAGRSVRRNVYTFEPHPEPIEVDAGDFRNIIRVVGSINEGLETRFFVSGTGVIKRSVRSGTGSRTEELMGYQLMP